MVNGQGIKIKKMKSTLRNFPHRIIHKIKILSNGMFVFKIRWPATAKTENPSRVPPFKAYHLGELHCIYRGRREVKENNLNSEPELPELQ